MTSKTDLAALRSASLFRRVRALTRTMAKARWTSSNGILRTYVHGANHCPLSFVATSVTGVPHPYNDVEAAGRTLGFTKPQSWLVADAADGHMCSDISTGLHNRQVDRMRRILQRAASLKESSQ